MRFRNTKIAAAAVAEGVELETRYDFDGKLQGSYCGSNHVLA